MSERTCAHGDAVQAAMQHWLDRAVIGLNLCPFAKAVQVRGQIRWAISPADDRIAVQQALRDELRLIAAADPQRHDTTLLVLPHALADFDDFLDAVERGERLLRKECLEGVLQLAHFHPAYRFAGSALDDVANCTNRAPYPTLHILRENSVGRAAAALPDPDRIYQDNIRTLRTLGWAGWQALGIAPAAGDGRAA